MLLDHSSEAIQVPETDGDTEETPREPTVIGVAVCDIL